jgi:hypothetical protein
MPRSGLGQENWRIESVCQSPTGGEAKLCVGVGVGVAKHEGAFTWNYGPHPGLGEGRVKSPLGVVPKSPGLWSPESAAANANANANANRSAQLQIQRKASDIRPGLSKSGTTQITHCTITMTRSGACIAHVHPRGGSSCPRCPSSFVPSFVPPDSDAPTPIEIVCRQ